MKIWILRDMQSLLLRRVCWEENRKVYRERTENVEITRYSLLCGVQFCREM